MYKTLDIEIARKCFCSLILDYEIEADNDFPAMCGGRVLIDGYFCCNIASDTRENLIKEFYSNEYHL